MTLAYSIVPKDLLGISRVRVYATTHNLITITKYKGVDPEVAMSGLDPGMREGNIILNQGPIYWV